VSAGYDDGVVINAGSAYDVDDIAPAAATRAHVGTPASPEVIDRIHADVRSGTIARDHVPTGAHAVTSSG
jgi:hypothetical protein